MIATQDDGYSRRDGRKRQCILSFYKVSDRK
jgi:hypothetical protein